MKTLVPSEVIHWRADSFVSMIVAVQFFALKLGMEFGQVIAETPSCAAWKVGLPRRMSV